MTPSTERLRLRRYTAADEPALFEVFADPYARGFYPEMADRARVRAWIDWNLRNYKEFGFGLWVLEIKESGRFIGDCGLTYQDLEGRQELEIGYHVAASERRKGYATEAARACLDFGFENTACENICSIVRPENTASCAVASRIHTARREFLKGGRPALLFHTTRREWDGLRASPWLGVPLADYEGHMQSPGVEQLDALSELFGEALAGCRPASVAVLGVAGGNGLDRVACGFTTRVVGIDVNPAYLDAVRGRYADRLNLELHCVDLARQPATLEPAQLVHAALVFEHAGAGRCLESALALVAPGGALSVVLQLPGEPGQDVAPTPFPSIQSLKPHFSLIDPVWLQERLAQCEFSLIRQARRGLPAGKAFWMGIFSRSSIAPER